MEEALLLVLCLDHMASEDLEVLHPREVKVVFEILARPHVDGFYFKAIPISRRAAEESHRVAGFCSCPPQSGPWAWNPQESHRKVKCKGLSYSSVLS